MSTSKSGSMSKSLSPAIFTLAFILAACSHNPNKAEKINTEITSKGTVDGETVGIKDGSMIVQKKELLSEQLRELQNSAYALQYEVYGNPYGSPGLYGALRDCKMKLSSHTDGKLQWTEAPEEIVQEMDVSKMGLDETQNLVGVSEEFLKDRVTRFQGYKKVLEKREYEYKQKNDMCQLELEKVLANEKH